MSVAGLCIPPDLQNGEMVSLTDTLEGLKENVIVGRLIPAGTGAVMNNMKLVASERDREMTALQAEAEQALANSDDDVVDEAKESANEGQSEVA